MSNFTDQSARAFEAPNPDPLAFFLTWTTYGTWLPGDDCGWADYRLGFQVPDPILESESQARMTEDVCLLNDEQRQLVENTIAEHCRIRSWQLHAVNCRSNHVHVVVSANRDPKEVRDQFKAWAVRKLKEQQLARRASKGSSLLRSEKSTVREKWWTERGSQRWIGDDESLKAAIEYVLHGQ